MQVLKGQDNLWGIESGVRLTEAANSPQMKKQFSSSHILQDHVKIVIVLNGKWH